MSLHVGKKGAADMYFGKKAVAAIYRGATLVWQKIRKLLVGGYGGGKSNCYEVIPSSNITLTDVSVMAVYDNYHDCSIKIINECGLCIASSSSVSIQSGVTIYGFTGWLNTVSSLGTVTLFAGNKYYINTKKNGDNEWSLARYDGETRNYKSCGDVINNMTVTSSAGSRKCFGTCTTFDDIKRGEANSYFTWKGNSIGGVAQMQPTNSGSGNPYPYLLKRNMNRVVKVFTDADFNGMADDIERFAYLFYTVGSTPSDEFIMNVGGTYGDGFKIVPNSDTKYFTNNAGKIYTLSNNISRNHVTSMTPIDMAAPANPELGDVYYKSANYTWGNISARAVVAWTGGQWVIATDVSLEWSADSQYDVTNYCEMITDPYAKDFNNINVQSGDKFYIRLNNTEV